MKHATLSDVLQFVIQYGCGIACACSLFSAIAYGLESNYEWNAHSRIIWTIYVLLPMFLMAAHFFKGNANSKLYILIVYIILFIYGVIVGETQKLKSLHSFLNVLSVWIFIFAQMNQNAKVNRARIQQSLVLQSY